MRVKVGYDIFPWPLCYLLSRVRHRILYTLFNFSWDKLNLALTLLVMILCGKRDGESEGERKGGGDIEGRRIASLQPIVGSS